MFLCKQGSKLECIQTGKGITQKSGILYVSNHMSELENNLIKLMIKCFWVEKKDRLNKKKEKFKRNCKI